MIIFFIFFYLLILLGRPWDFIGIALGITLRNAWDALKFIVIIHRKYGIFRMFAPCDFPCGFKVLNRSPYFVHT